MFTSGRNLRRRSLTQLRRERQIEHYSCGLWGGTLLSKAQEQRSPASAYEACMESFATTTTIQGLPKLVDSKNGPIRFLIWLGAFVGFGYLCFAQIIPLVARYNNRDTISTISSVATANGFFPAVTICPSAPHFRCDCKLFSATPQLALYADSLKCVNSTFDYVSGADPCGTAKPGFDYDHMLAQFNQYGYLREQDLAYYAAFTYEDAFMYWKFGEVDFESGATGKVLWTLEYEPSLGYGCWQFNPDFAQKQRRPLELEGLFLTYDMKLHLQSKLFRAETIRGGDEVGKAGWLGMSVGMRNSQSGARQEFQTSVGESIVVSLKRQDTKYLQGYGKSRCVAEANTSIESCTSDCLWEAGAQQCGCTDEFVGNCPTYFISTNLATPEGQELIDCVLGGWSNASYFEEYAQGLICRPFIDCEQPCFESDVLTSISSYPWPTEQLGDETASYLATRFNRSTLTADEIKKNMIQMRIFASTFTYQLTEEVPALLVGDLLGAVGGNLGLWAGFSFLTVVELGELVCVMLLIAFTFCFRGGAEAVTQIERKVTSNHNSKVLDDVLTDKEGQSSSHSGATAVVAATRED